VRIEAAVAVTPGSTLTEEALLALCADRLGAFKSPDHIHFLRELPKGPSGKIQRVKLRELLPQDFEPNP
jgi:acyl-coenzyme A synthetase/AMP-(fatty) acid ligase